MMAKYAIKTAVLLLVAAAIAGPANAAAKKPARHQAGPNSALLEAQVMLARIGFSPGVVDGRQGDNFVNALHAFQQANGLAPGRLDGATATRLSQLSAGPALAGYTIRPEDVAGPFVEKIPHDFQQMAALPRLAYRGPHQLLAEKFHMSEALLAALNPGKDLTQAGTVITVANVAANAPDPTPAAPTGESTGSSTPPSKQNAAGPAAAVVVVDKRQKAVLAYDAEKRLMGIYPASIGSAEKPAPSGTLQVRSVVRDPDYTYNPKYRFKGQTAERPVKVAPGPNNPVGVVWIGLSAEGYGIHGTPEPEKVGKTQSHGCVRLTNWDALALAGLVKKGTPVEFAG
jgi:lipoprotein-anchoring transpeptidase ErfK/SrfK